MNAHAGPASYARGAAEGRRPPLGGPQARMLPDGRRLHLQHGPIDLVVAASGRPDAVRTAYRSASDRFATVLGELCGTLDALRRPAGPADAPLDGPVARRMQRAVAPFAAAGFITPMAAVAGAVAEEILAAMTRAAVLDRAFVNNGGDVAFHLTPGESLAVGVADRPDRPTLFGRLRFAARDPVRGLATSGWRGRSFSLGVADAVTVLARTAAEADAAATVIANAVDLPGHPAIRRAPARTVQADSDLGERPVTRAVGPLSGPEIAAALGAGLGCARALLGRGLVAGAALRLQGVTETTGGFALLPPAGGDRPDGGTHA